MDELTFVDEIYMREPDYDFDIVRVMKDREGNHCWGRDSGCSCPMPFEDFQSFGDYYPLDNNHDFKVLVSEVSESSVSIAEQNNFITTVKDSLRLSGKSVS